MNTCTSNSKPCTISSITMNNWLGFSLSSNQDHPQNSVPHHLGFHSDEISAAQISSHQCFDLTPNSTIPSIFEAFNTNPPSQDWNMKDESINSFSCNTHQNQETPKLENFLEVGGQSFTNDNNMNVNTNNMGLSMIKNWLRNNAPPPHAAEEDKVDHEEAAPPPPTAAAGGQTLSLSMSTGSQSSDNKVQQCVDSQNSSVGAIESVPRKSIETFGQRTSIYRGVTRHRWTGRYEAHLWDNSCRREGQTRKGRQVYLGGYDKEDKAARSYDLAALKYWGTTTTTNFPISNYEKELEEMKHMTRQEYVASLRRKSSGFSRGASIYRGVTRHHQHGRWQARIGRVAGNKDLYLGTFSTQEEAAEAYDIAAIKFRGLNAVTNFEINRYDVRSIMESRNLPIGGGAKRLKDADKAEVALQMQRPNDNTLNTTYSWPALGFSPPQPLTLHPYQRMWCKEEQDSDVGFGEIHHHLQLGNNQSFLQPSMLQLHNVPGLESEPGPDPITGLGLVYENNVACEGINGFGYEGVFGSTDRNLYYQSSCTPTFTMWNGT